MMNIVQTRFGPAPISKPLADVRSMFVERPEHMSTFQFLSINKQITSVASKSNSSACLTPAGRTVAKSSSNMPRRSSKLVSPIVRSFARDRYAISRSSSADILCFVPVGPLFASPGRLGGGPE